MKFTKRDLGDASDASRGKSSLKENLTNVVLVIAFFALSFFLLGVIANMIAKYLPDKYEAKLSWDPPKAVQKLKHPRFQEVDGIFKKLIQSSSLRNLHYRLFVMEMKDPNAFAFPGGAVAVTDSFLDAVTNEKSIALVLGHELGHHQHRHFLKSLGRTIIAQLFLSAFPSSAAKLLLSGNNSFTNLVYSRAQETEADRFGVELVLQHYENLDGAFGFFKTIVKGGKSLPKWATVFSTHPYTPGRIKRMEEYAATILNKK